MPVLSSPRTRVEMLGATEVAAARWPRYRDRRESALEGQSSAGGAATGSRRVERQSTGGSIQLRVMVTIDKEILQGTPCFTGTRIPVHDIAAMLANGDSVVALLNAYPSLTREQVEAAPSYARAHPLPDRSHLRPPWRNQEPIASSTISLKDWRRHR